jgi:hypothetical protein
MLLQATHNPEHLSMSRDSDCTKQIGRATTVSPWKAANFTDIPECFLPIVEFAELDRTDAALRPDSCSYRTPSEVQTWSASTSQERRIQRTVHGPPKAQALEHFLFYCRPLIASLNQACALSGVMNGRASVMA